MDADLHSIIIVSDCHFHFNKAEMLYCNANRPVGHNSETGRIMRNRYLGYKIEAYLPTHEGYKP